MKQLANKPWYSIKEVTHFKRIQHFQKELQVLKKQTPNTCVPTTIGALRSITGAATFRRRTGGLTASQAMEMARNHPFVLIGEGIAGEGTTYVGSHHAVLIVEIDETTKEACILDLDDTVKGTEPDEIIRIVPIDVLLANFRPARAQPADFEGNADEPLESVVEPGDGTCTLL